MENDPYLVYTTLCADEAGCNVSFIFQKYLRVLMTKPNIPYPSDPTKVIYTSLQIPQG